MACTNCVVNSGLYSLCLLGVRKAHTHTPPSLSDSMFSTRRLLGYIVAPKNVRLIARASTFHALLTVTWDPVSGDGVEGYQVSYVVAPTQQHADDLSSRSSPAVKGVDTVGKHSTSYTITKLAFYTVYNVTVRATLAGNRYGSRSEVVSLRTIQAGRCFTRSVCVPLYVYMKHICCKV